jgi:hypothetical protein
MQRLENKLQFVGEKMPELKLRFAARPLRKPQRAEGHQFGISSLLYFIFCFVW